MGGKRWARGEGGEHRLKGEDSSWNGQQWSLFYYLSMLGQRHYTFGLTNTCKSDNSSVPQKAVLNTGATVNLDLVIGKIG